MLALILASLAFAQTCELQLVCDGVVVEAEPDGSYDLAPTCDSEPVQTGDTGAPEPRSDTGGADTGGADTGLGYSFVPDYAPGPYQPGANTIFLAGQSLCLGPRVENVTVDWWHDGTDTGQESEPALIGRRFMVGDGSGWGGTWGERRGPETGLDQSPWSPPLDVLKVCYGSTSIEQWLWTGGTQNDTPFVEVAFNRADQFIEVGPLFPTMRGYPAATCLLLGTEESKVGNPTRAADLQELQDRLQARWATDGSQHLLMVVETVGDPSVTGLPYLDDIRASDLQAAASDPDIVFVPAADIAAEHLLPDGKHLTARGLHLVGQRCGDVALAAGVLTE